MQLTVVTHLVSLALSGCTVIITTGIFSDVVSTNGIQIIAAVATHNARSDTVTARITNTSDRAVFIPRCGSEPLLFTQQFVNGAWTDSERPACPASGALLPIELDPGITVVTVRVFTATGRFRFVATVDDSKDFSTSARTASNVFAIP